MKKCNSCKQDKPLSDYYPYKHTKDYSSRDGHCHDCKKCMNDRVKRMRKEKPVEAKARAKFYADACKMKVYAHYSDNKFECKCCGEKEMVFLSIDHIDGGGTKHRKEQKISGGGYTLCRWIIRNGYPSGFQILCHNCNQAKHILGVCPHKKVKEYPLARMVESIGSGSCSCHPVRVAVAA